MPTLSQEAWLAAGFEALAAGGVDALRVEPLAEQLGVTKGSFYHHFGNRRALHEAMLEAWERRGTSDIIDDVDAVDSPPAERLRHLAHRTMRPVPTNDAIENAIRAWAATDDVAAAAIARVDERRLAYTAALLRSAGMSPAQARRRARLLYRILIGEFVWRSSGGPTATHADIDDAVDLILA
jgi:AcrR family transcriptional regulator